MASFVLHRSLPRNILLLVSCIQACCSIQIPAAFAQRPGHVGGGGHVAGGARIAPPRVVVPPPPHPTVSQPRVWAGSPLAGTRIPPGFRFRPGPTNGLRRRVFFGAPFFRFGLGFGYNPAWSSTCGAVWGWGFNCYPLPFYSYGVQNYLTPQTYEIPVYSYGYPYGGEEHDLVWLYLKDSTVYPVTDYWFVNGQTHFTMIGDDPTKPAEHVIAFDELDVQKTTYINTHRGFRIVFRDAPWQQYLRDHPDLSPPEVPPPQNN
jgi:hypothetical protein